MDSSFIQVIFIYQMRKRRAQWRTRQVVHNYEYTSTVDFLQLQNAFEKGTESQVLASFIILILKLALLSRSETLCSHSRKSTALSTVACNCGTSLIEGKTCFGTNTASSPIAEGLPCAGFFLSEIKLLIAEGSAQIIGTELGAKVEIFSTSISQGCTSILLSQISALQFQNRDKGSLSGHFVSISDLTDFGVKNAKEAVIGK